MSDSPLNISYQHLIVYGDNTECPDTPVLRPARDQVRKSVFPFSLAYHRPNIPNSAALAAFLS